MIKGRVYSSEEKKRFFEFVAMVLITVVLISLSRLEGTLFELSESLSTHHDFIISSVYFGLININIVLILALSFLFFRNVIKLVVERRRGVIGSKLRTKLVVALVFFALAPTALLFFVSNRFLIESFDTWFSSKVEATILKTREAGALVYKRDKRRIESLARIALQRIRIDDKALFFTLDLPVMRYEGLYGFEEEYRLDTVSLFDHRGKLLWKSGIADSEDFAKFSYTPFVIEAIDRFIKNPGMTSRGAVEVEEGRDVVKGIAPVRNPNTGELLGVILTEERFETQIIRSVEAILKEFASLRPGAKLIRLSYTIILVVVVLIILFSATWLGFYVAKGITNPIQRLAEATKEVASGNYKVTISTETDDETGHLVRAFNEMIKDLKSKDDKVRNFTHQLEKTNIELEEKRKHMEVVLRNISAGVISINPSEKITSVNHAAERLLGISAEHCIGRNARDGLGEIKWKVFWQPIREQMNKKSFYNGQIELEEIGHNLTLVATGTRIFDENNEDLGLVVVFDDASEQVKIQRVAAWREVARRIAHEIKNPITPIKLNAQRLARRFNNSFNEKDQDVFVSCIETIISEVDSLRDLVNEFSRFARLPAIKTSIQNVNEIVLEIKNHYRVTYPHITFKTTDLADKLPLLKLDKEQMNRVFGNLVSNAIAAIPESQEEGCVEFRSRLLDKLNTVRIEVADNGIGIPEKLKGRVLEPYFSTKTEGTGLGLAIVNQIVTDHGGYLRVEDNYPSGTVVAIEIPYEG